MVDHDQRFKVLLQEFFADFMRLVVPDWSDRFDFTQLTWLDKEAFLDPPQGARRALDLVAQLPVRVPVSHPETALGERWLVLVHMEIDAADSVAPLRPRMLGYYEYL